jgi:alpha-tubulin suppressor-like RCC1 family protein
MKTRLAGVFLARLLLGGLGLMLAGRLTAQTVTQIAAGSDHSLFVKSDGGLWGMGLNGNGQLGLAGFGETNVPQEIVSNGVVMVAAGYYFSHFQQGNALWAMGRNDDGELGDGSTNNHYSPEVIYAEGAYTTITALGAGSQSSHSLYALETSIRSISKYSYGLWSMGLNNYGQLGDGMYNTNSTSPTNVLSVNASGEISSIAAGYDHTLYVRPDGSLWGMGDNFYGELGIGSTPTSTSNPVMIVSSGVTAVAAGFGDSFFIKSDGSLWAMGLNQDGQLGDDRSNATVNTPEEVLTGVVAVAAGEYFALCIRSDGTLWGAGDNGNGQLGGELFTGFFCPIGVSNVVAIAAGQYHSLFIKSDGSLWGMGYNFYGQLGTGDYNDRAAPVEIVPPPRPTISSISVAGTNVVVTWPTNQGGFHLESTTNIIVPSGWGAVSPGVFIVNGQFTVTNPISASRQFYRLAE